MRRTLLVLAAGILGTGLTAFGQAANQGAPAQGRGRGGAPYAWNDKDRDGICDITGKPVGQGRAQMGRCGRGAGRGPGRGQCRCCGANASAQQTAPSTAPAPAK
jgi:hypothetical protein